MPLSQTLLLQGFRAQLQVHGVRMAVQSPGTGTLFCIVNRGNPFDPQTELGQDSREMATAECITAEAPALNANSRLRDANGQVWTVLQKNANPADFKTQFFIVEVVEGSDN